MKAWFRGQGGGFLGFLSVLALVAGGLGWVTSAALNLEAEQFAVRAESERYNKLRVALWRMDSLVAPALAKEDSRPYNHYSAVFAPAQALRSDGQLWPAGAVLEPSPLLNADLPDWMLLHFQVDHTGWRSPQVLSDELDARFHRDGIALTNVTPERERLLAGLGDHTQAATITALVVQRSTRAALADMTLIPGNNYIAQQNAMTNTAPTANSPVSQRVDPDYLSRLNRQMESQTRNTTKPQNDDAAIALDNLSRNGENWFTANPGRRKRSEQVAVKLGPMVPIWLPADGQSLTERLILARHVQIGDKSLCQGIVLDWPRLQSLLLDEVRGDLFPQAAVLPLREEQPAHFERAMALLPVQLTPGPLSTRLGTFEMTPLRIGLILAWSAALVALTAVAVGGWSLIALSERRIRFVSAVTHELRTPLTTLRLYLDMLAGGMVTDPKEKEEYLQTLNIEADRLNRLVGNVLDFSRLENQRPRLARSRVTLQDFVGQIVSIWQGRCEGMEKELIAEYLSSPESDVITDVQVLQQIVGNLIDNACKYSRGAADRRIWLRAGLNDARFIVEVEDRGPGVHQDERNHIFRPFRRGRSTEVVGGAGLGLALARRWAELLGGKLTLCQKPGKTGACFQLVIPRE
jgi:signal transduction histidine kinase